jgi:hypothetical protein
MDEWKEKSGLQIKTDLDIFIFSDKQVLESQQLCFRKLWMIWMLEDDLHL